MQDIDTNSFSKGMNKDVHPNMLQQGEYLEAFNAVQSSNNNGNSYFLNNEKGFSIFSNFYKNRRDNLILGMYPINERIIIFSIKVDSEMNTTSSEIGYLHLVNNVWEYKLVINDTNPNYFLTGYYDLTSLQNYTNEYQLKFNIQYQIQATARVFYNGHIVVYWTDGLNPPRYLDLDIDYSLLNNQFTHLSQQVELFDNYDYPVVNYSSTGSGGSLKAGVYQFAVRYLNKTLDPTAFGLMCNIIPVVDEDKTSSERKNYDGANFDSPLINKSINLTISNIDIDYDYLEIAVLFYSGSDSQPTAFIWKRLPITAKTINISFNGNTKLEDLTLNDLITLPVNYSSAQHLIQKDGRLFLSNLSQQESLDLQPIANMLELEYVVEEVEYDSTLINDYSEESYTYNKKGYQRNETYSFAISAITNNGETFAFHIPSKENNIQIRNSEPNAIGGKTLSSRTSGNPTGSIAITCRGKLGTYFSENIYLEKDKYIVQGVDLFNKPIRHFFMPTYDQEPHFRVDTNSGKTFIRILGVRIINLDSVLAAFPSLASKIQAINFLREKRDTPTKRSIYAMGMANTLLKQDGFYKPGEYTPGNVGGFTESIVPIHGGIYSVNPFFGNTHILDYSNAVFKLGRFTYRSLVEQLNDPLNKLSNIDYEALLLPGADSGVVNTFGSTGSSILAGSNLYNQFRLDYTVNTNEDSTFTAVRNLEWMNTGRDPYSNALPYLFSILNGGLLGTGFSKDINQNNYYNYKWTGLSTVTVIVPMIIKAGVPWLGAWSGQSSDENAIKNCAFYSPESILLKQFSTPIGAKVKPIMKISGSIYRLYLDDNPLVGGLLTNGDHAANTFSPHPFNVDDRTPRAPFFHLHCNWNDYNPNEDLIPYLSSLNTYKSGVTHINFIPYNTTVNDSTDILNKLKIKVPNTNGYINNYDGENYFLLTLDKQLCLPEKMPVLYSILGNITAFGDARDYNSNSNQGYNGVYLIDFHKFPDNILNWGNEYDYALGSFTPKQSNLVPNGATNLFYNTDRKIPSKNHSSIVNYDDPENRGFFNVNRYIYIIDSENKYQYGDLNASSYLLVQQFWKEAIANDPTNNGTLISFSNSSLIDIFNGDVFISKFYYRNSNRLSYAVYGAEGASGNSDTISGGYGRIVSKEGAEFRMGNYFWVESEVNCNYRHQPVEYDSNGSFTGTGASYYPRVDEQEALNPESDAASKQGYNIQYSFQNDKRLFFLRPFGFEYSTIFDTRTIFSEQTIEGEQSDYYRKFLPNSYQDLPKNKGQITNQFVQNNTLYLHTERALFKTFVNQTQALVSTNDEVYLGNGKIFGTPAIEIVPLNGGYAGSIHKWGNQNTPFGYFFVDYHQKKIFLFSEGLEEISQVGMYGFFSDLLNFPYDKKYQSKNSRFYNPNYINNPANPVGAGVVSVYDTELRRVITTIKTSSTTYKTLSFSLITKSWISFHDYKIGIGTQKDSLIISSPNNLDYNNLYLHNDSNASFGVYYINSPQEKINPIKNPFIVEFVSNKDFYKSKVFDSQMILLEFFELDKDNLQSYNSKEIKIKRKLLYEFFNFMEFYNSYQYSGKLECKIRDLRDVGVDEFEFNIQRFNNQYQLKLPLSTTTNNIEDLEDPTNYEVTEENKARLRDKYLISRFTYNNEDNYYLSLQQVLTKFRESFR